MEKGLLHGIIVIQVDDSICPGTSEFVNREENCSVKFFTKRKKVVQDEPTRFNCVDVVVIEKHTYMQQVEYIKGIEKPNYKQAFTFEAFRSVRAKCAYAAFSTVPDALFLVTKARAVHGQEMFDGQSGSIKHTAETSLHHTTCA